MAVPNMAQEIEVKTILNKTRKRDPWFLDDYTVNLYSSCSFNCLYCYIRGSKYGINLEKNVSVKINAIDLLDRQLWNRSKKGQYGIIVLSSATDPYQHLEKRYQLTRQALKVILRHRFPVHIITKSDLIERDFDLLHEIDHEAILPDDLKTQMNRGTIISFSFSTLDDEIGRIFEPAAPIPSIRLHGLNKCVQSGFLTGVSMMPLLPFISDTTEHLNLMFSTFQSIPVHYVLPATITLFGNGPADSKTLMLNTIGTHFPELEQKYLSHFHTSTEMPSRYHQTFCKKMNELCAEYGIHQNILSAVTRSV